MSKCPPVLTPEAAATLADIRRKHGLPPTIVKVLATEPPPEIDDRRVRGAITVDEALVVIPDAWDMLIARGIYPSDLRVGQAIGWSKPAVTVWRNRLIQEGLWTPPADVPPPSSRSTVTQRARNQARHKRMRAESERAVWVAVRRVRESGQVVTTRAVAEITGLSETHCRQIMRRLGIDRHGRWPAVAREGTQ